jgi:uncharacterized membrane protein YfcA
MYVTRYSRSRDIASGGAERHNETYVSGRGFPRGCCVTIVLVVLLGVTAGILVGLLGIGGGIVLVPAMVHVLRMDQHMAQGTSLFILLPPIGLGALGQYWKSGHVDLRAGILCATGMVVGAYLGGRIAVPMPTPALRGLFGGFLMFSAVLLWLRARQGKPAPAAKAGTE